MRALVNSLSFDVEEHFQVSGFASCVSRTEWGQYESRVERNTYRILELLSRNSVRATFFVLGWVAERHRELVRAIDAGGHEVGSHGYGHEMITAQNPGVFREDVRLAKRVLEDAIGKSVWGYRAPSFTITQETQWALPILVEEGYRYDSSIFPVLHDRYGIPGAIPSAHMISTASGPLLEIPPSTFEVLGVRVPVAGGGYFRFFPYPIMKTMLRQVEAAGDPLVLYLHPWEFDPEQPRMPGAMLSRVRHYLNLGKTESRFRSLIADFQFAPIREVFSDKCQSRGAEYLVGEIKERVVDRFSH